MRRLSGRLLAGLAIALVAALPGIWSAGAQDSWHEAGLIVIHGDGRVSYALVQFEEQALSAVDLLHQSGFQVTEVTFGALGIGVCSIDETGCDVSVCRKRVCQGAGPDDPYWQYLIAEADGSWGYSPLGISADSVAPGDVRVFIWSASEPTFAAPSIADVRARAVDAISDGVWLTRYDRDGHAVQPTTDDSGGLPVAGLAAVGVAACCALLVARRVRMIG